MKLLLEAWIAKRQKLRWEEAEAAAEAGLSEEAKEKFLRTARNATKSFKKKKAEAEQCQLTFSSGCLSLADEPKAMTTNTKGSSPVKQPRRS